MLGLDVLTGGNVVVEHKRTHKLDPLIILTFSNLKIISPFRVQLMLIELNSA